MLASDKVDAIITCKLASHCLCGGEIQLKEDTQRHQVYELPEIKLHVTEYQWEKGCCVKCRRSQTACLPEGVTFGMTGPKLTGFMSHLISRYHLSRRELRDFLKEHFNFTLSLGTVFNKQKIVNAALEAPVLELLGTVKESPFVNMDETGHCRDGRKEWMWGFISSTVAFFSVATSRGKKALKLLMGDFKNIVISDRYAAYNCFDSAHRQICWAHLKRDFTRVSEKKEGVVSRIGRNLLCCEAELFKVWHEFKQNKINRDELLRQVDPLRRRVGELLEQGSYTDPALKIARFCKNLLEDFNALWTFLTLEEIEPTNNHAERSLRPLVIWRKKYFGTRSNYGSEFVARSASIIMTCKLQSKNCFHFLSSVVKHHFLKSASPPLLSIG